MAVVFDPQAAGQMVFGEGTNAEDLIEAVGIADKIEAISGKIGSRLGNAVAEAQKRRDSEGGPDGVLALLRPWPDNEIPENVVSSAEQQFYANDRVIAALLGHLVEHIVIGEELRSIAASARRRSADELERLPPVMVEFVNRLMAAGVVVDDVWKMSRKRLAAVVAAIKGVEAEAVMADVEAVPGIPENAFSSEDARSGFFRNDAEEARSGSAEAHVGAPEEPVDDGGSPPEVRPLEPVEAGSQDVDGEVPAAVSEDGISGESGEAVSDSEPAVEMPQVADVEAAPEVAQPLRAKGRWDDLDLSALGYRIEEVTASSDADMEALRMKLPEVATIRELGLPNSPEMMMIDGVEGQRQRVMLEKFVRRYSDRTSRRVSEAEMRMWGLLLCDLPTGGSGRQLGMNGWYHGLSIPAGDGSSKVRRIIALDESDEGRRDAFVA